MSMSTRSLRQATDIRLPANRLSGLWSDRKFGLFALLTVAFNGGLFALLVFRPLSHNALVTVDNWAQFVGPLLVLPLCFAGPVSWLAWWRSGRRRLSYQDLVAPLIGLGIFSFAAGQIVWTFYELVLHQATPFPSIADVFFLAEYPFLLVGILLLPKHGLGAATRLRVGIDGFMILAAIVTFSWFFVLGPTVLQGGETALARVVGTAYPVWDLVLIACVFVLFTQREVGGSTHTALRAYEEWLTSLTPLP
jgi:hypothetical protein